ncbi:MAG: DUF6056 family protein [Bacillota bacterium]
MYSRDLIFRRLMHLFLVVFAALVGLACYYQPYITDDVSGRDSLASNSIFGTVVSGYFSFSGRILYMLMGTVEQKYDWFSCVHGLLIVILAVFVVKTAFRYIVLTRLWETAFITLAILLFWFGFCTLDTIVVWRSGSPYLWTLLVAALFILLLINSRINSCFTCISGVCAGLMHEGMSLGLIVFVMLFAIYQKVVRLKIPRRILWGAAGLFIGTILLLVAPGNYTRFDVLTIEANHTTDFFSSFPSYCYKTITTSNICLVYIVLLVVVAILRLYRNPKCAISLFLVIGGLASLMVPALTYSLARRFTAIPAFFFLLGTFELLALLFEKYREKIQGKTVLAAIITFAMLFVLIWDSYNGLISEIEFNKRIAEQEQAIISLRDSGVRDIAVYPIMGKRHRLVYYDSITFDPKHWKNEILAKHYGINSIVLMAPKLD